MRDDGGEAEQGQAIFPGTHNNSMQRAALRAAADAERWAACVYRSIDIAARSVPGW